MRQPLYIQAATAISPQYSFDRNRFLNPAIHTNTGKLFITEPDFREHINPVAIRRMSRLLKMAISAAMQSLQDAGSPTPDAIITGTGRGSLTDMEHFLNDMIRLDEGAMNPTSFIQSTYNSPNGWIAMQSKSTAYNQTYVHRGLSLELALLDAQLLFSDARQHQTALVGCYEELTDEYYFIKSKIGYFRQAPPDSLQLLQQTDTPGTIAGEGAAFFTLSNEPGQASTVIGEIMLVHAATAENIAAAAQQVLANAGLTADQIDVLLLGRNGDDAQDQLYTDITALFETHTDIAAFKHLCGEYDTSSGFALWLADHMIRTQSIPELTVAGRRYNRTPNLVLLINHYILGSASVMLLRNLK